jgi:hypothetical protein
MKTLVRLAITGLALGLVGQAPAAAEPTATAIVLADAPQALSPSATDADKLVVMQEVRVVAKRGDAENQALLAAAREALAQARLRHWKLNKVTEKDLLDSMVREERLSAFHLGQARIESVSQERMDGPDGQEAWKCRVMLSLRLK